MSSPSPLPSPDSVLAQAKQLHLRGDRETAARLYRMVLALAPADGAALCRLGVVGHQEGRSADGLTWAERALRVAAADPVANSNAGAILSALDRVGPALDRLRTAVTLAPAHATYLFNLANTLQRDGRYDQAITVYRRAIALDPDASALHWNLGLALLRTGRLGEGWRQYEWRWHRPGFPGKTHLLPDWDGQAHSGRTLLVYSEQGFGDAIQFARYLPAIAGLGLRVVVECQPALFRLFATILPDITVVPAGGATVEADLQASITSLPLLMGTASLADIPAVVPYFHPGEVAEPEPGDPPGPLKVAIAWTTSTASATNHARTCPLPLLASLAGIAGVRLHSVQVGPPAAELAGRPEAIRDLSPDIHDFLDTARLLAGMDLVVTVDTSIAHLAGALARPTWILLPEQADWRWLVGREDSPWYPTARLFRQARPGDWPGVADRVRTALERLAGSR